MQEKNKVKNQTFQYLKALLIIMVIDDHVSTRIGILSSIFPYNSFYMPLFVFISGYFYKKKSVTENIYNKVKHILVPYIVWCVIGNLIAFILAKLDIVYWYGSVNIKSILRTLLLSPISDVTGAGWFAIMLFYVSVIYNIYRNILVKEDLTTDVIILIISIVGGMWSLFQCINGVNGSLMVATLRFLFYFQFFHIGLMFKKYFEVILKKRNKAVVCLICVLVNLILLCLYGNSINFYSTSYMGSFNSWYLPLITSITGGIFWYEVTDYISNKIGENRYISFIADNTFTIMMVHLLFVNIPNFYVYNKIVNGSTLYSDFDISIFRESAWVRYSDNTRLIGFFCGLIGSIIISYLIVKTKSIIKKRI